MIRAYREDDLTRVLDIWYEASLIAHPFLDVVFLESERRAIAEEHMPNAESYVYERDGELLGFIALLGSEVGAIFVDPKEQRHGVGCRLMDHVCELKGELELDVFEDNRIGRAFYERYGFEFVSRHVHEPTGRRLLRLRLPEG